MFRAVLQNRLALPLHDQAVASAGQLPPAFRSRFVEGIAYAAKSGLQVGCGQTGAQLPPGLPSQVAARIDHLIRVVFDNGYVQALRPTVGVAVAVLAVASLSCLFVINRWRSKEEVATPVEIAVA